MNFVNQSSQDGRSAMCYVEIDLCDVDPDAICNDDMYCSQTSLSLPCLEFEK